MAKKTINKELTGAQDLYNFLFEACNIIRGPVSQDNFKDYITPLLYYKRISDVYDEETEEALISSGGDKEYASLPEQHRFVIPDGCHWQEVRERTENLGAAIVGAMRQIEIANPDTLYGVLSMFSSQKWTNKAILNDSKIRDLIEHLSKRKLGNKDYPADLMGDAYEILLKKFADDSKAQAGEFYTPRSVVRLLVHILDPQPGETVYDPACGSGGMLIEAIRYMHDDSLCCGSIFGQEKNVVNAAIAKMNLFLHGASDFNVMQGDTLRDPKILQGGNIAKFDCVIANPPFSLENWGATEWSSDKYKRNIYGTPSDSCGDYAWIQHMIHHLAPNGKIGLVLANGALSSQSSGEGDIRKNIIQADLVEGIVALPTQLFYSVTIPVTLWFISKNKKQKGKILFIDARKMGYMVDRKHRDFTEGTQEDGSLGDIDKLAKTFDDFQNGTLKEVKGFCAVADLQEIEKQDFILTPGRYVGIEEVKDDGEPFEKKMTRLTSELSEMFEKSHELEDEIRKKLGAIGYEV